jgi:hypothetical protein
MLCGYPRLHAVGVCGPIFGQVDEVMLHIPGCTFQGMERPAQVVGELCWMICVQSHSLPLSRLSFLVVLRNDLPVLVAERAVFNPCML